MTRSFSTALLLILYGTGIVRGIPHARAQPGVAARLPILQELGDIEELRSAFGKDAAAVRVVLLLSPT